jgi:hypothetical protein
VHTQPSGPPAPGQPWPGPLNPPPPHPTGVHACQPADLSEVRMSDCPNGCKVMRCAACRREQVVHLTIYGCRLVVAASLADLVPEAPWSLVQVDWSETWMGCEHCGRPIKRAHLIEEAATTRRIAVGRVCLRSFGIGVTR